MELSDDEIVQRVLAKETHLFELLMRRHNPRVYRAIRSVLRSESDVEDAMQQAYLQAFTHLAQWKGSAKLSTWLTRIAINEALGRVRGGRPVVSDEEVLLQQPSHEENPEAGAARHELGRLLEQALDALPEIYRMVLMLRDVEGLSTSEAAEALSVSDDVVKQRLVRGRAMLEQTLMAQAREGMGDAFAFHAVRCDRVVAGVLRQLVRVGSD